MSEIAACTLIQEEPGRKTERYLTMFKDYPDVVTVEHLQEMLGICRKNAYLLVKQNVSRQLELAERDGRQVEDGRDGLEVGAEDGL